MMQITIGSKLRHDTVVRGAGVMRNLQKGPNPEPSHH